MTANPMADTRKILQTRFRFLGDHAAEHCGCAAVSATILDLLSQQGKVVGAHDDYDVLVMNGEGTLHHGRPGFYEKMRALAQAQAEGRQTYLINSLWQQNPPMFDDVLTRLTGLSLRGVASQRDLADRHGIGAGIAIDLSYFAPVDEAAPFTDLKGGVAVTDLWMPDFGFVWLEDRPSDDWHVIDMQKMSWSSLVRTLRTASAVVAGRHHAMYAACVALTPFVPLVHNAHKIEDLLEFARAPIPICRSRAEIYRVLRWASSHTATYTDLFGWMADRPRPGTLDDAAGRPLAQVPAFVQTYRPRQLAEMAAARGDDLAAATHWETAAGQAKDRLTMHVQAGVAWMRAGDLEKGAALLYGVRGESPSRRGAVKAIRQQFLRQGVWLLPAPPDTWKGWALLAWQAIAAAASGDDAGFHTQAGLALARAAADGMLVRQAARLLIALRLARCMRQRLAMTWWTETVDPACPGWILDEDDLLVVKHCGDLARLDETLVARLAGGAAWPAAADMQELYLDTMWQRRGATPALAAQGRAALAAFPHDAAVFDMCCMLQHAVGNHSALSEIMALQVQAGQRLASRCAPIAAWCAAQGMPLSNEASGLAAFDAACLENRHRLFQRLSDRRRRVAIVGNGPSEMGKGRGADIDGHDEVVRFNAFRIGPGFAADYGQRTTVVATVSPIHDLDTYFGKIDIGSDIVIYADRARYAAMNLTAIARVAAAGMNISFEPLTIARDMVARHGIVPSTGCRFATALRLHRGTPDFALYGFHFNQADADRYHYFGNQRSYETHDWTEEDAVFRRLLSPAIDESALVLARDNFADS